MSKKNSLTEGAVTPALLKFIIPILLALALQSAYGIVDLWMVSNFSSVGDISGVTVASQINQVIINSCAGLAMGTTILLGLYIGAGEKEKASYTIGASIAIFGVISGVLTVCLFFGADFLVVFTQTPDEALVPATQYLQITAIGVTFLIFYNVLGSIFRGIGDSKTPLLSVGIAAIFNTILDLLFVAVFQMGAAGAALATTIAQAASVIICIVIIRKKKLPFTFKKSHITLNPFYSKEVIRLGCPMALQSILSTGSFLAVTAIINGFGVYASSSVGIVQKITTVIMLLSCSFMQALSAFVAQNRGAKLMDRAKKGLFVGLVLSFTVSLIAGYFTWFHGEIFVHIFTTEPPLVEASVQFLRAYAVEGIMVSIYFCMVGYFNGCGKTAFTSIQGTAISIVVRLPLTYWFSTMTDNLTIVGMSIPIATALQILLCIYYYHRMKRKGFYRDIENAV